MDDAEAIRFVNEQVRPLCEKAEALYVEIDAFRSRWTEIGSLFTADQEAAVEDGRHDTEGVSALTCGNVNDVKIQFYLFLGLMEATNVLNKIRLPTVRTLHVED